MVSFCSLCYGYVISMHYYFNLLVWEISFFICVSIFTHDTFNLVLLLRLEVLLVLMEDYKVVLKYQELLVIANLRRFADKNLFGHYLSLLFYLFIWKRYGVWLLS